MPDKSWREAQRSFFDATAGHYDANFEQSNPYMDFVLSRYIGAINPKEGDSILEIGASGGRFTTPLLDKGAHVTAIDVSPKSLEYMAGQLQSHPRWENLELLEEDATAPAKLGERRFDAVVGAHILHHVGDPALALRVLRGYLKPGGRVIFLEPNPWNFLWYLQITFHPGKSWAVERGIFQVWPGGILKNFRDGGYAEPENHCFGFFPPLFLNWIPGLSTVDVWFESLGPLSKLLTLNLFTAVNPEH